MIKWQNSNKVYVKPSVSSVFFSTAFNTGAASFAKGWSLFAGKMSRLFLQGLIFSLNLTSFLRQELSEMTTRVC